MRTDDESRYLREIGGSTRAGPPGALNSGNALSAQWSARPGDPAGSTVCQKQRHQKLGYRSRQNRPLNRINPIASMRPVSTD
jgi:hypothetical protein